LNKIKQILEETQMDPSNLDLEITESTLMDEPEQSASILKELRQMGIKISLDDFGTGYSSLNYLKRFDVSAVKLDKSFVRDITSNVDDAAISKAVIAMAHGLGLNVIAEGVETLRQLIMLDELGCDDIQGYFINKPMPEDEFTRILSVTQATFSDRIVISHPKAA
jgi:EAL domain-containing protein (putative c-di-GMP-specific phosphodiesterase class I)